ncbi:MAG: hypothetical protein IKQ41_13470 [Clostridia bacterium]|nr:hypothetical protein [Clostridia bacterium]
MGKRIFAAALSLLLFAAPALGEMTVERMEGERYFPNEQNWVYHYTYAYPQVQGEDLTAALINDTYQMALEEMTQLVLPMFANAEDMRFDGKNEVTHDFAVMCNNGRLLSILQKRTQTMGSEGVSFVLEALTFDVGGMYAGETLTLRGVALIQGGVDAESLEDVNGQEHPELKYLIDGSSAEMAAALTPVLYREFQRLQSENVMDPQITREAFETAFSAARDFYTDDENRLVFFFPPSLMLTPSLTPPAFSFTPFELNDLLRDWEA